ncbi:hypothetical protein NEF87_000462 [Candidatus Lokiarchaeum ossiferum]|uniref:Uncharacterized protein n=1 Tax=Candidatus Lokiarchaeum ossiferum TaxID=2951803 RepID=A0ABY6HKY7_9ARCH|nr:hypothetical protein NEF87_000462 [Candidatus Lokiarchaeum sp. B-35]
MAEIGTSLKNSSKVKRFVLASSLIGIVTISTFVGMNLNLFGFGEADGIFPVLISPNPSMESDFYEGEPIVFNATVYKILKGEVETTSADNFNFQTDLNFTWYFRSIEWETPIKLYESPGAAHIALSALKPGTYEISVEVIGIETDYDLLNPNDYLIDNASEPINYALAQFTVHPLISLDSWISHPADYSNHIMGEPIQFNGITRSTVNSSVTNHLVEANVDIVNQVTHFIDQTELEQVVTSQLPFLDVSTVVGSIEYLDPIQLEYLIPSKSAQIEWIDDYIDPQGQVTQNILIGDNYDITINSLPIGFHSIRMQVMDETTNYTSSSTVNLWISNSTQPTVPYLHEFYNDLTMEGNFILDWDASIPTTPNTIIQTYDIQQTSRTDILYLDDQEYIEEQSTFYNISTETTYKMFENFTSTTDFTKYEEGKVWFRVRAVDSNGIYSHWTQPIGMTVDRAPSNIYCSGVFGEDAERIDLHSTEYTSQKGEIIDDQINDNFLETGEFRPNPAFFDLYEGQFEQSENRSEFETIYSQLPSTSIEEAISILQYQPFSIHLQQVNSSLPIDPDTEANQLRYTLISDLDGKLFSGKGYGDTIQISWEEQIYPYLTSQEIDFCGLSVGHHIMTILIQDTFDLIYQLPSLVINVSEYIPLWENITLQTTPESFYDYTGDGRHDLSEIVLQGDLPHLNPYYPNWESIKPQYIKYWYFQVFQEYGNQSFEEIFQVNASHVNTTATSFTYLVQGLISSNYTFHIAVEDVHGHVSNWSTSLLIVNTSNAPLVAPYDHKLPILLDADNPPPNPVIGLINTYYADEISQISTDELLLLNASQSSDLNGDSLEYTWHFDGSGIETWYESYDLHAEVLEVSPEICGNDLDPEFELDMRDGDHYGDWGVHEITLEVFDGVTSVNTSILVEIIPPNVAPEITGLAFYNGHVDAATSLAYMYDAETCILYPDHLFHFDHLLNPQTLSISYILTDLTSQSTSYLGTKSIPREEFSFENPLLNPNRALEYGIILQQMQPGFYDINATISDGYVSISCNFSFEVKVDITPYDLGITLKNQNGGEIEKIDGKYTILLNQPLKFELQWIDNHPDSQAEISVSASGLGVIYEGPGIRLIDSLSEKSHFTKGGETELTFTVRDQWGKSNSTSITVMVYYVTILNDDNTNTVARQIAISKEYLGHGYSKLNNFGDVDRSEKYVNTWSSELGDDQIDTDDGYYADTYLSLDPSIFMDAEYVRVWFQLDSRFDKDYLEFYDGDGDLVWKIRRHSDSATAGYQYLAGDNTWKSLYQMQLSSTRDNLETNYLSTTWEHSINSRLVYVVVPGDTVTMKWKTGSKDGALANVFGKRGFRIAYYEALGESEIKLRSPLDLNLDKFNAFLGLNKNELVGNVLGTVIKAVWYKLIEIWFENEWDSRWVEFTEEVDYLGALTFEISAMYNRFTSEFRVNLDVEYEPKKTPGVGAAMNSVKLSVGGSGTFAAIIDPFQLKEASMSFFGKASKEISIVALIGKLPGMSKIGSSIKKADKYLDKYGYGFPKIDLYVEFRISGGYRSDLGWYGLFEVTVGASITFFKKLVHLGVDLGMYIGGSQKKGFTWGITANAYFKIRLTLKALIGNYWWVPGSTLYSKKYTIRVVLPFF